MVDDEDTELARRIARSHEARRMAESFGVDPERYDRTRPGYPTAMVDRIVATSPGRDVLDVGVGTGIAARQFEAAGCRVLGVEVDDRMATLARRRGTPVEVAAFEEWDPAGRTVDIVVAGQTWHWIDPVAGAAKAASVLRPGGRIAVFWNALEPPAGLADVFAEVHRRALCDPSTPGAAPASTPRPPQPPPGPPTSAADGYALMATKAVGGLREVGGFGEVEEWRFPWERTYTREEWLDQLPTSGTLTRVPPEALAPVLDRVGAAIDAVGGRFTARYTTVVATALRLDDSRQTA